MSNFASKRITYGITDRRWARDLLALDTIDVTLDGSQWPAGTTIPSGTHVGRITASKMCAPYNAGATNGTQKSIGLLVNDYMPKAGRKALVAVASGGGPVDRRYVPSPDEDAEADLPAVNFIN